MKSFMSRSSEKFFIQIIKNLNKSRIYSMIIIRFFCIKIVKIIKIFFATPSQITTFILFKMKPFTIIFLIIALLSSIAFSVPTNYDCNKDSVLKLIKPKEGAIYPINSTRIVEFEKLKGCYSDKDVKVTFEVFSIGKKKVVDTIIEQEYVS